MGSLSPPLLIYGYGRSQAITLEQASAAIEAHLATSHMEVSLVGDFDIEEVRLSSASQAEIEAWGVPPEQWSRVSRVFVHDLCLEAHKVNVDAIGEERGFSVVGRTPSRVRNMMP